VSEFNEDGSVTSWLNALKQGHPGAAQAIWERYLDQLLSIARAHLREVRDPRTDRDEEDVAASVFQSFYQGARAGRFPKLDDRDDLWKLLLTITHHKVVDRVKYRAALKRGAGRTVNEADLPADHDGVAYRPLEQIVGTEPTPEFSAQVADQMRHLLELLSDPTLRQIAELKLACWTNEEIRHQLGCSLRRVTLKLELIRKKWATELPG